MKALYTHNYGSHVTENQIGIEAAHSGGWSEFIGASSRPYEVYFYS